MNTVIRHSALIRRAARVLVRRAGFALSALLLGAVTVFGQNLTIQSGAAFAGNGTIRLKGNIVNSGIADSVYVSGRTILTGAAQSIGTASSGVLSFDELSIDGTGTKSLNVTAAVRDSFSIHNGATFDISGDSLRILGESGISSGTLTTNSLSVVNYGRNDGTPQSVLALTYTGKLLLTGSSTKSLAGAVIADSLTHSGSPVSIDQNLTINGAAAFDTISGISATKILSFGSNPSTVAVLQGNSGTIAGGSGSVTFNGAATNGSTITGGTGRLTFAGALSHNNGTITAGSGDIVFNAPVTLDNNAIILSASASDSLSFGSSVTFNSAAGALQLTGTGAANFGSSVNTVSVSNLDFSTTSRVTYSGGMQTLAVPASQYGTLTLAGSGAKSLGGSVNVATELVLAQNLITAADSLTLNNSSTIVSGDSAVIGKVTRSHSFAAGTEYAFNGKDVKVSFASLENSDVTVSMYPYTNPTSASGSYVQRRYLVNTLADRTSNTMSFRAMYEDGELIGISDESKLGFRRLNGAEYEKLISNGGAYTRNVAGSFNTILLTNIAQNFLELGIKPIEYATVSDGDINASTTWGGTSDDVPSAASDTTIVRHSITVSSDKSLGTVIVLKDATYTGMLNIDNANITATGAVTIQPGATLNVFTGRQLTVNGVLNAEGTLIVDGIINLEE